MLTGFVFMALGMRIYMKAAQCCGPRDSLLVGLGKRMPRVPICVVEIILWAVVLLAGWLLDEETIPAHNHESKAEFLP